MVAGDNMKIFVSGLALQSDTNSLKTYFQQFGEIQEAVVITDHRNGTSMGHGFVTFKDPTSASRAIVNSSPLIDGIRVNATLVVFDAYTHDDAIRRRCSQPAPAVYDQGSNLHHPIPSLKFPYNFNPFGVPNNNFLTNPFGVVNNVQTIPFGVASNNVQPSPFGVASNNGNTSLFSVGSNNLQTSPFGNNVQTSPFGTSNNVHTSLFGVASQNVQTSPFGVGVANNDMLTNRFGVANSNMQTNRFGVANNDVQTNAQHLFEPFHNSSLFDNQNAKETVFPPSQSSSTFDAPPRNSTVSLFSPKTLVPFKFLEMAMDMETGSPARNKNFVFSPCSIQLALSLVASGSKGSTLKEFLTFLEAKDLNNLNEVAVHVIDLLTEGTNEGGGPKLSFVGGIWVDQSVILKKSFETLAVETYRSKAKAVDFKNNLKEVIDEVNKWAEEATNGLIKNLLPKDIDPRTCVALANAIYFKGAWSRKFYEKSTKKSAFYLLDGSTVDIPFMSSERKQYISCYNDFKVLRLPYEKDVNKRSALSMYIVLPNRDNGIWRLIKMVGSDPSFFDRYIHPYGCEISVGEFKIPKFKITYDFDASKVLQRNGLELPFTGKAEFNEMTEGGELAISQVIHKAHIEVNEEGTEAAAATVVLTSYFGAGPLTMTRDIDFVADHPFMFIVRDDSSGALLFMGHVINPLL